MKRLITSAIFIAVVTAAPIATTHAVRAQTAPSPAPAATAAPQQIGGTTASSTPINAQSINPITNSAATGTNVNTQINTVPLGLYSYGIGIQCPTPQFTMGLFQQNLNQNAANIGTNASGFGASVGYQAPVGHAPAKTCQALGDEILKQKTLDTQLTMIAKCGEFVKAGLVLHPEINPALKPIADVCSAITLKEQADVPIKTISDTPQTTATTMPPLTVTNKTAPWKFDRKIVDANTPCTKYHKPSQYERYLLLQLRTGKKTDAKAERSLRCVDRVALMRAV